jgi:hypothetical protein
MTNLNNLKEYLDNKLNEDERSNNLFPKSTITKGFCDQLQYIIDNKRKDISVSETQAKDIMGSVSSTDQIGAPHYNEYDLQKIQYKIESMESEIESISIILKDFEKLHKDVSGNKWLPRNKRTSSKNKSSTFFNKRFKTA